MFLHAPLTNWYWLYSVTTFRSSSTQYTTLNMSLNTTMPQSYLTNPSFCSLEWTSPILNDKTLVRSGIRTHAHRSGLRPERSALDRSAILTLKKWWEFGCTVAWTVSKHLTLAQRCPGCELSSLELTFVILQLEITNFLSLSNVSRKIHHF